MLFRVKPNSDKSKQRVIENDFPFIEISEIAQAESWRKEIYRPIYHIHKWWAQRLGSVFRAIILASALPEESDITKLFYEPVQLSNFVVFDPFMGSGTTVGEALKFGCKVIGRDINPVACFAVKNALGPVGRRQLEKGFHQVESQVAEELRSLYVSKDSEGYPCDVLYYFWVKVLPCPQCKHPVDLFTRFIFASHAYPKKYKEARAVCPSCGEINVVQNDSNNHRCNNCNVSFNPNSGWAKSINALCPNCGNKFKMAQTAREQGHPPEHRMYAKLVLTKDGEKEYLRVTDEDIQIYNQISKRLNQLTSPYPSIEIVSGYNTDQVLNYGYKYWHQMFNDRQLLGLSLLANAIKEVKDASARDVLACLFSGVLEFNNMFASYKGEGTGAVRHMFSHHILKPERMPLEANIWGTRKSSGSFSTLYKSRLLRAMKYRENPFELAIDEVNNKIKGTKVYGVSKPIRANILNNYPKEGLEEGQIYISCASSSNTDIPSKSVDLIITDPPFFDNVHYSELADFFYVWQHHFFGSSTYLASNETTTRSPDEVQATNTETFTENLLKVLKECYRVLNDDGLLVFTYHHSREEGWMAVTEAVLDAGFRFIKAHPVKSEMSVAVPKSQSKKPINLDVILVCRKDLEQHQAKQSAKINLESIESIIEECLRIVNRYNAAGWYLSQGDIKVIFLAKLLVNLSRGRKVREIDYQMRTLNEDIQNAIIKIYNRQVSEKANSLKEKRAIKKKDEKATGTFLEPGL